MDPDKVGGERVSLPGITTAKQGAKKMNKNNRYK